jgi:50S ribosomal protein L16 3-hydroxylase
MDASLPLPLLGGLSPRQFMRRHWQKKPLLVRQAIRGMRPVLSAAQLFALAGREEVEARLIVQPPVSGRQKGGWQMKRGPLNRRALPPLTQPGWTLLVQGVDLHHDPAYELMNRFRFVPDARLDDLMISLATEGGGVGPHFDSYDVFLLQASGSRRWQIGAQQDLSLQPDVPLKILRHFQPEQEFVLHAGDMLYLPPRYAHDGVAVRCLDTDGKPELCMTYSIGFRAPAQAELASALLQRLADAVIEEAEGQPSRIYRDPAQPATDLPAQVPPALQDFARKSLAQALRDPSRLACILGEYLSEPQPSVWFEPRQALQGLPAGQALHLHARTRMLYDADHVFINGESYRAGGGDARLMRQLADQRVLAPGRWGRASEGARALLAQWLSDGWLQCGPRGAPPQKEM